MQAADSQASTLAGLVRPLRENPSASAVLCDVDGTLAPIVERAEDAAVPAPARRELEELARSYAIVACISGRRAIVARELVGIDGLTYVGNHGYERLAPRAAEAEPVPELGGHEDDAAELIASLDVTELDARGLRIEDKGPIRALHWRGAPDEVAAARRADEIAADAQASLRAGEIVEWPVEQTRQTIADGMRTPRIGNVTFAHISAHVDDIVTVSEDEIRQAWRRLPVRAVECHRIPTVSRPQRPGTRPRPGPPKLDEREKKSKYNLPQNAVV